MRFLLLTALGTTAAVVLATGGASKPDAAKPAPSAQEATAGVIQTGKTLGELSPDEINYDPVTVPEPVWASVLAACAVSLLRRGRR